MYAVIESGGKQHKVIEGEVLRLEKLDAAAGESIQFDKVLMLADGDNLTLGAPYVEGGSVTAEVLDQGRADKLRIIKFRRRKHYRRQMGHRQYFTEVRITSIDSAKPAKKASAKKAAPVEQVAATEE